MRPESLGWSIYHRVVSSDLLLKIVGASSGRLLGTAASFLLAVLLSRWLDKTELGQFYFSLSVLFGSSIVARLGLRDVIMIRLGAGQGVALQEGSRDVFLQFAALVLSASVVLGTLIMGVVEIVEVTGQASTSALSLLLVLVGLPLISLQQLSGGALRGLGRPTFAAYLEFLVPPLFTVVSLFGLRDLLHGIYLTEAAVLYLVGLAISDVALFSMTAHALPKCGHASVIAPKRKAVMRQGLTFLEIELSAYLIGWSSFFLLPFFLSLGSLGIYNAAVRLAAIGSILFVGVAAVGIPMLSNGYASADAGKLKLLLKRLWITMLVIGATLLVTIVVFGNFFLSIFGPEFRGAFDALLILSLGNAINLAMGPAGMLLSVTGYEKVVRNITVFTGGASVVLTVLLCPVWGIVGAAAATAISGVFERACLALYFLFIRSSIFNRLRVESSPCDRLAPSGT